MNKGNGLEKGIIENVFDNLKLEKGKIIFIHARLKGLKTKYSYADLTKKIIEVIEKKLEPSTVLIPTYTYSFLKTGIFDRYKTPSEVGRFSEEARLLYGGKHRLLNPVFSMIDTNKKFIKQNVNYTTAFGKNSIYENLSREGYYVLNINLDNFYFAHLHYIEQKMQVPYRKIKKFPGTIVDLTNRIDVNFEYFIRELNIETAWRRDKVKNLFASNDLIREINQKDFRVLAVHSKKADQLLLDKVGKDRYWLVNDK